MNLNLHYGPDDVEVSYPIKGCEVHQVPRIGEKIKRLMKADHYETKKTYKVVDVVWFKVQDGIGFAQADVYLVEIGERNKVPPAPIMKLPPPDETNSL